MNLLILFPQKNVPLMQRGFGGKIYPQKAKINLSKTAEKSINSGQDKFFLKKSKKSVAKIVRLIYADK